MSYFQVFISLVAICVHSSAISGERSVIYSSGALRIKAFIATPEISAPHTAGATSRSGPKYPVVLFNHGGISGLNENSKRRCRELAAKGYVVFASSFRGEDGSEGTVEVALGEVDDVLAGLHWLEQNATITHSNLQRIALVGFSHGALISLQAAKRTHRFKALVFSYGVSDIYSWVHYLRATKQLGQDALTLKIYGTGPQSRPSEYAARFGLANLAQLDPTLSVLIVQGKLDQIVPPFQAEVLTKALKTHAIRTTVRYYPDAKHGFLIRREALIGAEKRQSDQAWQEIYQFLADALQGQ